MSVLTMLIGVLAGAILLADVKILLPIVFSFFPRPSRSLQNFLVGPVRSLHMRVPCLRIFHSTRHKAWIVWSTASTESLDLGVGQQWDLFSWSVSHCRARACISRFRMGELISGSYVTDDHCPWISCLLVFIDPS